MECSLCQEPALLCDSHILPEFVYRPAYDDNHTTLVLDQVTGKKSKRQKGFTEQLFCSECEGRFGRWENYFADVWFNPRRRLRPASLTAPTALVGGLDYTRFKLFHLSVMWRASVSTLPAFRGLTLRGQQEPVRQRLLRNEPGESGEYPFIGLALRDPITQAFQDQIIKAPEAARLEGHWCYSLIFGGVLWIYFASDSVAAGLVPIAFGTDGLLTLGVQDWVDNPFVQRFADSYRKAQGRNQ